MEHWLNLFILFLFDFRYVACLFVTDINVPDIVDFRENVTLSCSYDLNGQILNSVKWYKDKAEFFRYSPMQSDVLPRTYMKFPVIGVQVQEGRYFCDNKTCRVDLSLLGAKSTGIYKCEVSGDKPLFKLAAKAANMTVAALPQSDPFIENFNSMYRLEDYVSATCASDYSSLPTKLTWYINGEQAPLNELLPNVYTNISAHDYMLQRNKLPVNFYLSTPRFYHAGKILQLKCIAEIENYPDLRRETMLSASLIHYDNLHNQMLIHANAGADRCAQLISIFVALPLLILVAIYLS